MIKLETLRALIPEGCPVWIVKKHDKTYGRLFVIFLNGNIYDKTYEFEKAKLIVKALVEGYKSAYNFVKELERGDEE